jgi:hypothetical protein
VWVDDMVVFDGWHWVLFDVGCWHECVGARIRGLMVAVGFALDVAAVGFSLFYGLVFFFFTLFKRWVYWICWDTRSLSFFFFFIEKKWIR